MLFLLLLQVYILSRSQSIIAHFVNQYSLRSFFELKPSRLLRKNIGLPRLVNMSIEEKFQAGVKVIQSLPKDGPYQPSYSTKLKFYSLFKQASDGPCTQGKPAFWDVVGRAKWEAWNKLGEMTKEEAMTLYIEELKKIVETMSFNGDVQDFLDSIGPFYEFINLQGEEFKHVKEIIDEVTSSSCTDSSSSSNSNSVIGSPSHSLPNSPLMTSNTVPQTSVDDNESVSIKVTVHANSNGHLPNRDTPVTNLITSTPFIEKNYNKDSDFSTLSSNTIPSAPSVSKLIPNGYATCSTQVQSDRDKENEVFENCHDQASNDRTCEETKMTANKQKLSSKLSVETLESGADSEKYYSGDSDQEFEDHLVSYNNITTGNTAGSSGYQSYGEDTLNNQSQLYNAKVNDNCGRIMDHLVTRNHMTATSSYLDISNQSRNSNLVLHATVDRLNRDMEHILARLRILEAAYTASADRNMTGRNQTGTRRKRLIFNELSTSSIIFILTWPFAAHFLIKLVTMWLRRRRNGRSILSISNRS